MVESICKWSNWQGINLQNVQTAHGAQFCCRQKSILSPFWTVSLTCLPLLLLLESYIMAYLRILPLWLTKLKCLCSELYPPVDDRKEEINTSAYRFNHLKINGFFILFPHFPPHLWSIKEPDIQTLPDKMVIERHYSGISVVIWLSE